MILEVTAAKGGGSSQVICQPELRCYFHVTLTPVTYIYYSCISRDIHCATGCTPSSTSVTPMNHFDVAAVLRITALTNM